MDVKITPVVGKVYIKLESVKSRTKSGIELVNTGPEWQKETLLAEIMAKNEADKEYEVGQVVLIRGDAGRWIDPELTEDKTMIFRIIDKEEIIGIVQKNDLTLLDAAAQALPVSMDVV